MDIPVEELQLLKCSICERYLSRGPVYLQHDGEAACDRCYTPERPAIRNTLYEAAARLLEFPCNYQVFGCRIKMPYVGEDEAIVHDEEVCEYRQYVCPVLGSARCDWLGRRAALFAHCRDQHPDSVLENPATFVHDICKASERTYLLQAFQLPFLLHTKVCLVSGKLFHAVRFLGSAGDAANYYFTLDINRGIEQLRKVGRVAPQDCLAIQKLSSLILDTNSLLSILDGFESIAFTVTVKQRVRCAGCAVEVTMFRYRGEDGWRCERCAPARRACENQRQGCTHTDIADKCSKHEDYFCQQLTECNICDASVSQDLLSAHYGSVHQDIIHPAGSTWRATAGYRECILPSIAGTAVFEYWLFHSHFCLRVYTPLASARLCEFRCEVRLTDPATGHSCTFTPDPVYDWDCDWRIMVKEEEIPWWNTEFDVCVEIKEAERL